MNDAYNIPDEQGRVLINIGHPENDEDIFLAPQIARVIKPHQVKLVTILFLLTFNIIIISFKMLLRHVVPANILTVLFGTNGHSKSSETLVFKFSVFDLNTCQ